MTYHALMLLIIIEIGSGTLLSLCSIALLFI